MERQRRGWLGTGLLIAGALVVAVAIVTGGTLARAVNGVAALLWFGSLWLVWTSLGSERRRLALTAVTVVTTLVLVLVVKPSDLFMAAVGFSIAGLIVSVAAGRSEVQWAAMVPALWLPVHLGVTIGRALTSASQGG
ncbi:MAG TPA: hypothetical protein VGR16_13335, partial [Thermomicrobiales bacterium]|nr:hypothetical protein [Thermomicrobiales bacterium]